MSKYRTHFVEKQKVIKTNKKKKNAKTTKYIVMYLANIVGDSNLKPIV